MDEKLAALVLPADYSERSCSSALTGANANVNYIPSVPPPSSDEVAWWDGPGQSRPFYSSPISNIDSSITSECPGGVVPIHEFQNPSRRKANPFDSPADSPLSSSPTSSDEELYTHALTLQTPMAPVPAARKPPPPPPPRSAKPERPGSES